MKKIIRNRSDEAGRQFWDSAEMSAQGVQEWPDWKKAGVTAEQPGVVADGLLGTTAAAAPPSGR
jgi:hypothetical protein